MFQTGKGPQNSETPAQRGKYFKLQISGWTDFDPMDKELSEIAGAIEQGGGFLSAIEVVEVEDDLAAIKDTEVREAFQNILAARRVLRSLGDLPKKVVEELRSALRVQEEVDERKPPGSAESQADDLAKKVVEELRLMVQEEVDERKPPGSAESQPDWVRKQFLK